MGTSRGGKEKKRELSNHELKLRQRLQESLSLGIRLFDKKEKRWECIDAETQWYALRAIDAFVACISSAPLQHPLIKESVADILVALEGILQSENEKILSMAMEVVTKLIRNLGSSTRQYNIINVVFALSKLLSLSHSTITISSVIALSHILTNLGCMRSDTYSEVWKALGSANTVGNISLAIQNYEEGIMPSEYFTQMASLLKAILRKWPPSRYWVWSNSALMAKLGARFSYQDSTVIVHVLQLWSALALCGHGALKLLENEELLSKIVWALESSQICSIRIEALKLCQQLSRSQELCSKLTMIHCEPIVQGIVSSLCGWRTSGSGKVPSDQMVLVKEACQSALMSCWAGLHHSYLWKLEIDRILLDLLLDRSRIPFENQVPFNPDNMIAESSSSSIEIRSSIWNVIGWLAVHCAENFLPNKGKSGCLDALINIACSVAHQFWYKRKACLSSNLCESESVSRAVLLMLLSPCKYISLHTKACLSEVSRTSGEEYLDKLLASLLSTLSNVSLSDSLHTHISLISLACYSTLPLYQQFIVQQKGTDLMAAIITRYLKKEMHRVSNGELCCWSNIEGWESGDRVLFHCLQILSQLIHLVPICDYPKSDLNDSVPSNISGGSVESLRESLSSILENNSSPGIQRYAQYVLSFFGLYGFPSEFGKRMKVALAEKELADLQFMLWDSSCLRVHSAILAAACPYLLPHKDTLMKKKMLDCGSFKENRHQETNYRHEIKLSESVDSSSFAKILEYIYAGFINIEDEEVKPVRILAKRCALSSLSDMLNQKLPEWGSSAVSCDFSHMLEPTEQHLSDIILEADMMIEVAWSCPICALTLPHIHAHKIILNSNCGYLRALFRSGMCESYSNTIKVPIGFPALTKLVAWFYSGKLPRIDLDCYWNNMTTAEQIKELQAYLELSSLAQFWLLEEVEEDSLNMILSCLEQNHKLSMAIINLALDLHQLRIVEAAAINIAPLYPKMRDSGELDNFTEEAVDLLRSEYVRYSQQGFLKDE